MVHLAQLQQDFQAYLLDSNLDSNKGEAFSKHMIDDKKVGIKKRLGIYYDAYRLRIIDVLGNDYPQLKTYLGDGLFAHTARAYVAQHPSTYCNMRWVGQHMSAHLHATLPQHPIAAELATFEWALGVAFDAEDAPVLRLPDLAAIAPEKWADLRFQLHPCVQLLTFKFNALQIWQALNTEQIVPKVTQSAEPCVVWRKDLNSHYRSLDHAEYAAILQVIAGASFGELCEKLQENATEEQAIDGQSMRQAAQYLSSWLTEGMITAF